VKMGDSIIENTAEYVQTVLEGAEGGHDWSHTERVWKMACHIREQEGEGDLLTIELAALLHDVSDPKFNGGDEQAGYQLAVKFLSERKLDRERTRHVGEIIRHISFKGGQAEHQLDTIEFRIVQDADRLDALGAIGIARAFNYGGFRNLPIHDPGIPMREYADSKAYYGSKAPTINHFHEKLLKLKGLMNTPTGKRMAEERHAFLETFLEQFYRETDPGLLS
jgi:uncharacterized protein